MSDTRLSCPHCQTSLKLPGSIPAGKKLKCPKCAGIFTSPEPEEPPEAVTVPRKAREAVDDDDVDAEAPERPARRRRREVDDDYDDEESQARDDADEDFDDERPRRRRRRRGRRPSGGRSGAVTTVGIVNIVFGVLAVLCGFLMIIGASFIGFGGAAAQRAMANNPQGAQVAGGAAAVASGLAVIIAVVLIVFAALYILAGVGVLKRQQWGRIMTIVLASLSAIGLVINIMQIAMGGAFSPMAIPGFVVTIGYVTLCFVVLFNRDYAAEFE